MDVDELEIIARDVETQHIEDTIPEKKIWYCKYHVYRRGRVL